MKTTADLQLRCFPTFDPGAFRSLNEACFRLWLQVWTATFEELQVEQKMITSDEYLNRELIGLFDKDKPVGFLLVHFPDLRQLAHTRTSYFGNYPKDLLHDLISLQEPVMVISNMTIAPQWRKSQTDLPVSELLLGVSILRFLESPLKRMISYFRNNRSTNEIFYRHGGRPLRIAERAYNVEVDFGEITRKSARLSPIQECAAITLQKWEQYRSLGGQNGDKHDLFTPHGAVSLNV